MKILGLDASSTTIGICLIECNDPLQIDWTNPAPSLTLCHLSYFKPPKDGNIFSRLQTTRNFIINLLKEHKPDKIILEDIVLFMAGHSTAKTITTLAVLNRCVGLAILDEVGAPPEMMSVMKVRHATKAGKKITSKEDVPELIASILGIEFPWELNPRSRPKNKPKVENFDLADAANLVLAWLRLQQPRLKKSKKKAKLNDNG